MKPIIRNTYAEAFDGLFARLLVTARDKKHLVKAAQGSASLPLTVLGESEAGIEAWVSEKETPDARPGAIIQVWVGYNKDAASSLARELGKRIRQGILVVPTTTVFNALESTDRIDIMDTVGHCGDGYEWEAEHHHRKVISIPIMMGDFKIERYLGYKRGVMGGNIWFLCDSIESALEAGDAAIEAIRRVEGVITPFDVCSAGSKVETNFPDIGATTNHPYCPTLKEKLGKESMVPEGVESIPEIVINGVSIEAVKNAMKIGIESVMNINGVMEISAGSFGGKLGKYKIFLREL